nr:hypothetical protein [Paraglaciecola sp. 20A4]
MAYLSDLGETMNAMRGNTWAVLVDMRGWVVPISVSSSPLKSDVNLDRRNQKIECWVVDSPSQGDALLPYFVESGIVPRCFSEISEACACLQNAGYIDKTESIDEINWLVRYLAPS